MDNVLFNFWLNGGALKGIAERKTQEQNGEVLRTNINDYTVDSCFTFDEGYETAIFYKNNDMVIVERYSNKEEMEKGHKKWCDFCKLSPIEVYSVQKDRLERLNKRLDIEKYTKNIGTAVYISDLETVLNLIQEKVKTIEAQQAEIEKKDKQISRLIDLSINLNKEIDKLKLIAGLSLKGRPLEINRKALNALENTIEIEQTENMINDSFIFRAR